MIPVLFGQSALPRSAVLPRLFLEEPLLLTAGLIAAALATFYILNRQGNVKKAVVVGGAGLALAVGVQILAFSVQTAREKIIAATTPLVQATAAADTARLDPMLDPQVVLTNERGLAAGELPLGQSWEKARILSEVREQLGSKWRIKECDVLSVQGVIDAPGRGRTQVVVKTLLEVAAIGVPITTTWRVSWKEDQSGKWRVIGIEPVDLGLTRRIR